MGNEKSHFKTRLRSLSKKECVNKFFIPLGGILVDYIIPDHDILLKLGNYHKDLNFIGNNLKINPYQLGGYQRIYVIVLYL